jgi:hypothetical protein
VGRHVRFWHKADIPGVISDVRFRGVSRMTDGDQTVIATSKHRPISAYLTQDMTVGRLIEVLEDLPFSYDGSRLTPRSRPQIDCARPGRLFQDPERADYGDRPRIRNLTHDGDRSD